MADNQRPSELQLLAETTDRQRLGADRRRCFRRSRGITAAGPVENDNAEVALQLAEHRMGKVMHLAGKAVNEQQDRSFSFIEIVDARAVDVDETPERRQSLLHLAGRPGGKKNQAGKDDADEDDDDTHDPGDHCFVPPASQFQYVTGISRSTNAAYLASEPTRMRCFRFSTPRTMISPAISGGMVRWDSKNLRRLIRSSPDRLLGSRAFFAIAVVTPPGCTTVMPIRVPASSLRNASEKPRTANLLAQYAVCPGGAIKPNRLEMLTSRASSLICRSGRKARVICTTPQKLMPNSQSKSLSATSRKVPPSATPALLTRTSTPPCSAITCAGRAETAARSETSR